ncbi:MAG: citramalate synthase, partial [Actinomycetota bacterium]
MNNYPRVVLTEECMRDGLQIERMQSTDAKLALLDALVDAGLRRIVVGSFVHPKWTPQMADTDELLGRLQPREGVTYLALALNEKGRQRMAGWTPPLTMDELPGTLLHLDPVFIKRNTNRTMEQQEATWRVAIDAAKAAGATQASIGLSSGWGSNFTGKVDREHRLSRLAEQFDLWTAAGIEVASATFADPMGWVTPNDLAEDLNVLTATYPSITEYYLHLHNTRGLALTSAYAAVGALDSRHTLRLDCAV